MTRRVRTFLATLVLALGGGAAGCGDGGGKCPGIICTDCSGSGDCNVTCTGSDVQFCGAFGYFDDPALRCAFCAPPGYQP